MPGFVQQSVGCGPGSARLDGWVHRFGDVHDLSLAVLGTFVLGTFDGERIGVTGTLKRNLEACPRESRGYSGGGLVRGRLAL